jgi:hypothetical protein
MAADGDLGLFAEHRLLEFQGYVLTQVRTPLGAGAPARASAEKIAETEEVAKNLAEILEGAGIDARRSNSAYTSMAEAVVGAAFIAVRKNGISFAALFELLFRIGIVGVAIRVKLQRQLAVGALDLLLAGGAGNPEDFVVIAFYVASQNRVFAFVENAKLNVWGYAPLVPLPGATAALSTCSRVATHR